MSRALAALRSIALVALVALVALPSPARADYSCGGQNDTCQCGGNNPYPCCNNGGNCTWWAWHSACCNWGIALPGWGNANTWAQYAKANPNFEVVGSPVPGSIATSTKGGYGHVAWVIAVNGGNVTVSEESCCGSCSWGMNTHTYSASYFNSGFVVRKGQLAECSPGQVQAHGCGNCGTESRTCGSNGKWGGWSGCQGQGPCAPGQGQTEACGDCGTHSRSCSGGCQWQGWSGCEGPDPGGGKSACDTGEPGVCAEGIQRCVQGWTKCVRTTEPSDELCDGLDNDCDGPADEGRPATMGATPPEYGAELVDLSYPPVMPPGGEGLAWADFRNVGSATWTKGALWLQAQGGTDEAPAASALWPAGGWPAWDVAAVVAEDVPPGGIARVVVPLQAPPAAATVAQEMALLAPGGAPVQCPSPAFELKVKVMADLAEASAPPSGDGRKGDRATGAAGPAPAKGAPPPEAEAQAAPDPGAPPAAPAPADAPAGGCGTGGVPGAGAPLLALLLLLARRRSA